MKASRFSAFDEVTFEKAKDPDTLAFGKATLTDALQYSVTFDFSVDPDEAAGFRITYPDELISLTENKKHELRGRFIAWADSEEM